uniref:Uncharacterized protein n=1 Tax=Brassica campestris TaxID=3711 RepID=A0A3P5ZQA5_BRACM|nr:unnamed protein product [Brassica rapa]
MWLASKSGVYSANAALLASVSGIMLPPGTGRRHLSMDRLGHMDSKKPLHLREQRFGRCGDPH